MTVTSPADLKAYLASRREMIERTLEQCLPGFAIEPRVIHEAMRYSVLGGGKRIRPILAAAAAEACGAAVNPRLRHFAALELIHTYSLVHDDLPALDDDDLRRGRETAHVVYGEAIAILVGDALLTEAFSWLSRPLAEVTAERQLLAIQSVATAVDSRGMIGGQVADLEAEGLEGAGLDQEALVRQLEFIHRNKTGQLITASVLLGGLLAGASEEQLEALRSYGEATGLAFQIVDDLLDEEGTAETLGKTAGKDAVQGKLTYPAVLGKEAARQRLAQLLEAAVSSADKISGSMNFLGPIARYVCERTS
ncbi:MAG TPA: farnesyl diphosphate synthase [Thermoanaerobaculia bacterium]|nr:farnesyl diphosphate synthase [Thermoanaerobaculia bacterium]